MESDRKLELNPADDDDDDIFGDGSGVSEEERKNKIQLARTAVMSARPSIFNAPCRHSKIKL